MKQVVMLAALAMLPGCGIPPVISIASYALDGVVLAASGKTPSDHALSAVAGQDCSMLRVVTLDDVCAEYEPTPEAAAALAVMPENEAYLMTTSDGRIIRVAADPDGVGAPPESLAATEVRLSWVPPAPLAAD